VADASKTAKVIIRWYYSRPHWQLVDVVVGDINFLWKLPFWMCQSLHVVVNKCINCCFAHLLQLQRAGGRHWILAATCNCKDDGTPRSERSQLWHRRSIVIWHRPTWAPGNGSGRNSFWDRGPSSLNRLNRRFLPYLSVHYISLYAYVYGRLSLFVTHER